MVSEGNRGPGELDLIRFLADARKHRDYWEQLASVETDDKRRREAQHMVEMFSAFIRSLESALASHRLN
jgi:hypothetical protein